MSLKECPYCGFCGDKEIKRKTKCIGCNAYIYVRKGNLLTQNQMIFQDSLERLECLSIPNFDDYSIDSLDKLWWVLEDLLDKAQEGQDFKTMSTILFNMGVMAEMEGNYKNCIENYMLSCHFWAKERIESFEEISIPIKFEDLIESNCMYARPVQSSIKHLSLKDVNCNNLGKLAVTQKLSVSSKIEILEEALKGETSRLREVYEDEKYSDI